MSYFTELSIEMANQRNYLDELFQVYPTIPEGIRDINPCKWSQIEEAFNNREMDTLIRLLLNLDLFPIKDSYVAYLKRDTSAIERNPNTIERLYGRLCELGLNKIYERCSEPKETNRQIGPMFRRWVKMGALGAPVCPMSEFIRSSGNAILDAHDNEMLRFAKEHLNYRGSKGLDFIAKYNNKYVAGEAKFLTDFGGHQNAQFNDAVALLEETIDAEKVAILDGVLYIKGRNKMYKSITEKYTDYNIMSALVLREYLYQI